MRRIYLRFFTSSRLIHKYLKDEKYGGVIRVGIGRFTKQSELEILINAIEEIAEG